jgi:SRSO17 transposase
MSTVMDANALSLDDLLAYAEAFRGTFPRSEQGRWFAAYLWGLLEAPGRKSIEAIARALPEAAAPPGSSPSQSLQHFLTRSPWDEAELLRRMRARIEALGEPGSVWIVHDAVFRKRGRHSVGVHRQFMRSLGTKVNCQTGVMVSQVGPAGFIPLAIRLYLPRAWLDAANERQLREVPPDCRRPLGKDQIGLALLDELLNEGSKPGAVVTAAGYSTAPEIVEELRTRGLNVVAYDSSVRAAERGGEWLNYALGLDHFEGRSWRGWHHHAAAVLAAHAFLARERPYRVPNFGEC